LASVTSRSRVIAREDGSADANVTSAGGYEAEKRIVVMPGDDHGVPGGRY
jgi:hypothetical protein